MVDEVLRTVQPTSVARVDDRSRALLCATSNKPMNHMEVCKIRLVLILMIVADVLVHEGVGLH